MRENISQNERHRIIDLICQFPDIEDMNRRNMLIRSLPTPIRSIIESYSDINGHVRSIITTLLDQTWLLEGQMEHPLIIFLKEVCHTAPATESAQRLQEIIKSLEQHTTCEEFIPQPSEPISYSSVVEEKNIWTQLADFVGQLSLLQQQTQDFYLQFYNYILISNGNRILDVLQEHIRIIIAYKELLQSSYRLPITLIAPRITLQQQLLEVHQRLIRAQEKIQAFINKYGSTRQQPADELYSIQTMIYAIGQNYIMMQQELQKIQAHTATIERQVHLEILKTPIRPYDEQTG
jgi:hypothetical protein